MTIYIAICDNNVADRKHLERLLEREKDSRLKNDFDVLYIDSFGSEDALMQTPIKYDMFFIDVTEGAHNGMEIAKSLRQKGIIAPIVLCKSTVSYTSFVNSPKELIFIDKPLNAGQITHLVDVALDKSGKKIPLMEIRCQHETRFIKHTELIRAIKKEAFLTELSLSDGSFLKVNDSIDNLYLQCRQYDCFVRCKKDIVNVLHVEDCAKGYFKLTNGDIVPFSHFQRDYILRVLARNIHKLLDSE